MKFRNTFFLFSSIFILVLNTGEAARKPHKIKHPLTRSIEIVETEITPVEEVSSLPPPSNAEHFVTVCSEGNQIGGQLTTYAVILGYAWANGLTPVFPKEALLQRPGGEINYKYLLHRLPQEFPGDSTKASARHFYGYPESTPLGYNGGDVCICNMPNYPLPFYNRFRKQIRALFGPSEEVIEELRVKYASVIDHPKTVAVHIRAYDPRTVPHQCLGKAYFEKVMNYFSDDHLFVIFSDRIDWCKDHIDVTNKNAVFIEGNPHILDLYLMSLCKNIITANSMFSWWAAYLKKNPTGLILVPEKWFPNERPAYRSTFYPSHYITVPVDSIPLSDSSLLDYDTRSLGDI
ncbi:MAG TPA: alpha-1,2-fucosyltransferase [Chlamydiales bacterium]|nr:alpha-1,2-fucosyltransferase [Chlamydiales bacterium]